MLTVLTGPAPLKLLALLTIKAVYRWHICPYTLLAVQLEHRYDNGYIAFWVLKQNVEWSGVGDVHKTVMTIRTPAVLKRQKLQK